MSLVQSNSKAEAEEILEINEINEFTKNDQLNQNFKSEIKVDDNL